MSIIPSPVKYTRVASVDDGLLLSGPVTVSYSGEGADAVAGYLCDYFSESLQVDSLAESQVAAADTEGVALIPVVLRLANDFFNGKKYALYLLANVLGQAYITA